MIQMCIVFDVIIAHMAVLIPLCGFWCPQLCELLSRRPLTQMQAIFDVAVEFTGSIDTFFTTLKDAPLHHFRFVYSSHR